MARDYSREAAHRRYEKAYDAANAAGAITQAAVNDAYVNLFQNADWTPEEGWADQYQEGPEAYRPASYLGSGWAQTEYGSPYQSASSYTSALEQPSNIPDPVTMGVEEDDDLKRESGYNEQGEKEDDAQEGQSLLTPMVQRISDQSRAVENMSEDERFNLAKQSLARNVQAQNDRDQDAARAIMENQLISQYAVSGANPYDDQAFQANLQQIQNTNDTPDELTRVVRDASRRFTGDPSGYNLLGFTSQEMTPDNARNVYEMGFNQLGNIEPTSASADNEARQNFASLDIPGLDSIFDVDRNLIDDGRSEDSREAMFMTGEQYLRYINDFGIPGRPTRQIDPDEIYSKQDEMENYGFIPYLVTREGFDRFHDAASENAVSNVFNDVANARRLTTDYTINYGDQSISGKDLQRNSSVWSKNLKNAMENPDPNKQVFDRSQASEFAVPHKAVYSIQTQDGQSATHDGEPSKLQYPDGHIEFTWPDGTNWSFDDAADFEASAGVSYQPTTDDDELASMWYEIEPLELDDGTKIRADRAQQMLSDIYNNMDEYADYGIGNIAKPNVENPLEGVVPWLSDIFTGSAPLFYAPVAGAQATAGAMNAYQGMRPGYNDYVNGTYSMVSQDPREDQRVLATLGNAALPLTERLWGPIGGSVLGGVTKRIPGVRNVGEAITNSKPWQRWLAGTAGEAAEEVPGNIVEELMNGSGFDWYANPILDENGNSRYDEQGRQMYDPNTPLGQRVGNFLEDAPLAMLGGAAMGGILGTANIPKYRQEYAIQQALEGLPKIEEGYSENVTTPLTEREIREYNR